MSPPNRRQVRGLLSLGEIQTIADSEAYESADVQEVIGRVRGPIPDGATVRAVLTTLHEGVLDEQTVGESLVDDTGSYRIEYQHTAASAGSDISLSVRLYAPDGTLVVESAPYLSPPRVARINLRATRASGELSEYAFLEREIAEGLESGVAGIEGAEESVVEEVSAWLDVDSERLMLLQQARALENDTGLPAPMFYAMGRSGLGPSIDDLVDVPTHELRSTLDQAIADGIVNANQLGDLDALVDQLSQQIIERATRPDRQPSEAGFADILAAADLPPEVIARLLKQYQSRSPDVTAFWDSWAETSDAEDLGEEARDVEVAIRLGEILGPDPDLLRRVHARRREGAWQSPKDLAGFTFDDWCDILEDVEDDAPMNGDAESSESTEEVQARVHARAEAILDALEEEFPSEFIRREFSSSTALSDNARTVIERASEHDYYTESIRSAVESTPELVEGLSAEDAEAALEEVEAVERVSRVTDHADEVAVLVENGMKSAMEIAATPRRQFVDRFARALGGRAQASRVHAQAQQTAAGTKLAALRLLQSIQHMPFVLGPPPDIKGMPDARTLFQAAGGFCDCEHCGSVYSPAAYLVDLLRYLNVSSPERLKRLEDSQAGLTQLGFFQPLDVLLGRRPDLADLPLTCENTQTSLPYIDLVNELLEARITGGNAAFDTGKTPADVLRAVPQNISREAYRILQQAVHPLSLPYHQPLAVARAYLAHLGVTRLELMRALGRGLSPDHSLRDALVAESLSMSPEEFAMVARAPADLWRQFGLSANSYAGVPFVDVLKHAPALLEATGITFQNLIDLVSTRFINADNQLQLEAPTIDCNPDTVRLVGLDEARLSRMVRLIRLQRRLTWSFPILDRALATFGATDLDVDVLEKLATARDLANQLQRPVVELLVLWAPIDTWGTDNQFDRLLTTRAVAWRTQDAKTFQLKPDRSELAETGDTLDSVASALLAAFRITNEELASIRALLTRRGAPPRLDLAGLSAVYRVVVLARAVQLRVNALDLLLRLVPADADPLRSNDPSTTRRFIEIVNEVQASDFTPERLAYLFRHEWEPRRNPGPLSGQVESVLNSIRRGLADAFAETSRPADVSGDTLRQKLAIVLDPALVDSAMEILDPRTSSTAAVRRDFFDRHLARIFPDPPAAAERLCAPVAPGTSRQDLDARWRANITLVLDHLLPQLRTRLLRGSVVQTLSDALGLSVPSTALLVDHVMRSRDRRGEPLLRDFLAMLGTGLTGAYYSNPEFSGEPAVVRVDPELSFSWGGAAPAEGIPGREFSVRWTGRFIPPKKASHTFYIQTDGAVRLTLKVDGTDRVLIEQPSAKRVVEHASQPVALDPRELVEIRLEYRNQGGPATMTLQFGTGPGAKQLLPTPGLYPADGISSFAAAEQSYRRLHKAALILTGFGATDAQLAWLAGDPPFMNLDALPMEPSSDAEAAALFRRWRHLAALYALRKKLPRSNVDLFDVFSARTLPEAVDRLVLATGWDRGAVDAFIGPDGFAIDDASKLRPSPDQSDEPAIRRLARAMDIQRRVGVAPATLTTWASSTPDPDAAVSIVQSVKARYDETRWLEVAGQLNDPLRAERRDALVAYLLPRMHDLGVRTRNQLFEYFLIDVDMNPCMLTSRIRQAIGAVQTFFQRCLMNLEPKVPPRVIDDNDWKWMKYYRVWEANRKVFLYPENWIEPELRDDKSPLFQVLERTILQQEIKNDNVEAAFSDYLEGLDEISRLDVRGVWFEARPEHRMVRPAPVALGVIPPPPKSEWDTGTYHVFARTFNAPHIWYYRRLESGRTWTAWERIEVDIEGDHLVPVVFNRRLHLFWTSFREKSKDPPALKKDSSGPPPPVIKDWEIHLAYSVYDRGKWSRKRMSSGGVVDEGTSITVVGGVPMVFGSHALSPSDYTLRATVSEHGELPQLHLHVYCRVASNIQVLHSGHLSPREVQPIARFSLDGCSGALTPDRHRAIREATYQPQTRTYSSRYSHVRGRRVRRSTQVRTTAASMRQHSASTSHPFHIHAGGDLNAPTGYQVHGMGFGATPNNGALLAMPTADARGVSVALSAPRHAHQHAYVLPVVNPNHPQARGLFPFFFQDRFRSYFVRPIFADWKPPRPVAIPVFASRRRFLPPPARATARRPVPPPRLRRGGHGRREEIDEFIDLNPEAIDAWDDSQDEAWHPDDAAEAKAPRERTRPPQQKPGPTRMTSVAVPQRPQPARRTAAPAVAVRPTRPRRHYVFRQQAGYHEQRLQFTPFEHPDTCTFLSRLKAKGIDGLLSFSTTRPPQGRDHVLRPDGQWALKPQTWFQRRYGIGPLVFTRSLPHLDVAFEVDSPYALYNWELFFHAPLQVAVRLAKDGRHEEAQRWFHFIFDPTTDSRSPSPKRFWRFAPFYENNEYDSARAMMQVLSYSGTEPNLTKEQRARLAEKQQQVRNQLSAWWEKPFSPHVIARLRIAAYQKAVVMKYIDNLVEWGDKLFRRDTMESIQEATQIYILAANILGPRPEKIPPIVSQAPLTFQQMRHDLNLFSNFEVRLENLQIRRPFRINARPDVGGVTALLGMATQYFCTPPNPQLDKYWDTVADRLFKIRNCMNISGIVRQLALFDPPIDPGLLVRAAAAGVDLGSVIASLNAPPPHYRFSFLLGRAIRLAEEIRTFGKMTLEVLERRDAEGLASLRAANETALLDAVRDIRKKHVRQVEEELAELNACREEVEVKIQHINQQLQQFMNPQEEQQQKSLTAAQVYSGISEGVDLVAKVMHAIPDFQTGAAGAFSSPFVTLQLGGQMFGEIASAFASSFDKVMSKHETEADMADQQAEYQRRRDEWQHEANVLAKEKAQIEKRIAETRVKIEISSAELRRHDLEVDNAKKIESYLRDKYTNQQLYGWMLGQLSGVYFRAYKAAFDAAQQAERAFRFERGDQSSAFIEFSYWDSLKNGLFAGERLLVDLRRLEAAHVEGDRRSLEITRLISLRQDFPVALMELLATGRCQIAVTESLLDGDFPGHYFRRVKTASLTIAGALKPHTNVNCTLTLLENRIRTDANASGNYAQAADADDLRFLVNIAPIQVVATSKPDGDSGLFRLNFDDQRYLPFEGAGAISTWRIELRQADNAIDLSQLNDVVLTLSYTARSGGGALEAAARAEREKGLARGGIKPEPQHMLSLKHDVPAGWKKLEETAAGQEVEVPLTIDAGRFSGRYRDLDLRVERVTAFAQPRVPGGAETLKLRLDPPKGSGTELTGWSPPWPNTRMLRTSGDVTGPAGTWKLAITATGAKVPDLFEDIVLVFEVRARKS